MIWSARHERPLPPLVACSAIIAQITRLGLVGSGAASKSDSGGGSRTSLFRLPRRQSVLKLLAAVVIFYSMAMGLTYLFQRDTPSMPGKWPSGTTLQGAASSTAGDPGFIQMLGSKSRDPGDLIKSLEHGHEYFEWNDWLDLSDASKYDYGKLDPNVYPYVSSKDISQISFPYDSRTSQEEQAMVGMLYCRDRLSAPQMVAVLSNQAEVEKRTQPPKHYGVKHKKVSRCHTQHAMPHSDDYPNWRRPITAALDRDVSFDSRLSIEIEQNLFEWDVFSLLQEDHEDLGDKIHQESLQDALDRVRQSDKFFHEVNIKHDPVGYGVHYDWRFFRGVMDDETHRAVIHSMLRAWAQFADGNGIAYWMAHGSLIGWYWNGMMLPWDTDNDIQMPVMELDRLARDFNGTLVVQQPGDGGRKFLIEVSPWYVQRVKGNGKNVIDGRFIDVDSGVYIDITGLARTKRRDEVNCKNGHYYTRDKLIPLRRTLYEGFPVYVPNKPEEVLRQEYKSYDVEPYRDAVAEWSFNKKLRLWVRNMTCDEFKSHHSTQAIVACVPSHMMGDDECDKDEWDTCDSDLIDFSKKTKDVISEHEHEMILWSAFRALRSKGAVSDVPDQLKGMLRQYYPQFYSFDAADEANDTSPDYGGA